MKRCLVKKKGRMDVYNVQDMAINTLRRCKIPRGILIVLYRVCRVNMHGFTVELISDRKEIKVATRVNGMDGDARAKRSDSTFSYDVESTAVR